VAALAELLAPNWIVRRRENDHAHAVWTLAKPVHKYPTARPGPLLFLAEIGDYYAQTAGADPAYSGLLAHNPTRHFREEEFSVTWGHREPRTLEQLASVIPFGWERPAVRQTGIGRNADIFAAGMSWAGRKANAHLPVLPALMSIMEEVLEAHPAADHSYTVAEVQASARMIETYRERWAANGWHKPAWIEKQRRVAGSGMAKRRTKTADRDAGIVEAVAAGRSMLAVARDYDLDESTVRHIVARDAPLFASAHTNRLTEARPWEAEGVSRATWFRRRQTPATKLNNRS